MIRQSAIKLWYNFLQIAISQGVPVNWTFYASWGTPEEISSWSFHKWWKTRGNDLFRSDQLSSHSVELVSSNKDYVTVKIPLQAPLDQTRREISEIVLKARPSRRIGSVTKYGFTGQINYTTLVQYKRYLEIDLDPKNQGKTIQQKALLLKELYVKLANKGKAQRATLRKQGKSVIANKFSNRDPESFDKKMLGGITPNRISRWRLSGKHLILNVASGVFPGTNYYGQQLHKKLQERLQIIGLEDIGNVIKAKGGRKRFRPTKEERNQKLKLGMKGWGATRGTKTNIDKGDIPEIYGMKYMSSSKENESIQLSEVSEPTEENSIDRYSEIYVVN